MWGRPAALAPFRPNFNAYGLGWMLRDYRGRKLVAHTGTLAGFVSRTTMLPELGLGMVVLANQEETGAHASITCTIWKRHLPTGSRPSANGARRSRQRGSDSQEGLIRPRRLKALAAADAYLTFYLGPDGAIQNLRMAPVSPLTGFGFDVQDLDLRPNPAE